MVWMQNYDPCNSPLYSTLLAALPTILLLGVLASGRFSAATAALIGLLTSLAVAIFVFAPTVVWSPDGPGLLDWTNTVIAAAVYGAAFGLFPIGWIVLSAIFLFTLTVETGQFEIVKHSVLSLSADRRLQALLIAFCFGAFVEGAAGFGTPVAISAALLMGAGFRPLHAAGLSLLANTSPVAFGSLGTPILTLAKVTGLDADLLSAMAGRQLPFFSLLVPAWLVWVMAGWRGMLGVWPALLVAGGSFALVQYLVANFHGPRLVDVAGGVVSLVCLGMLLRFWQPRHIWLFPEEARTHENQSSSPLPGAAFSRRQIFHAWVPWILLSVFVFGWGFPWVKERLDEATIHREVPGLHRQVQRTPPVVASPQPEEVVFKLDLLAATGTSIFLAAAVSACWLRVHPRRFVRLWLRTCYRLRWPLFTIACMLAIAFTTRYSGMDATLGLAFTRTGYLYPLFAVLLGWLGVALTGSDTSSNALFGSLQTITARRLADADVLPLAAPQAMLLLAASNSTGGVMGKMIDAQSIVVSAAATGQAGQEGAILRFVFWHSLLLALLMGLLVMVQAYWWTAAIP
jgi:lactate permease